MVRNYHQIDISDKYAGIIDEKQEEMMKLISENAKLGTYRKAFDKKYKVISDELSVLKENNRRE